MFLLSLYRIIKYGGQNFTRNFWLSLVTVTIIVLSLFSISILGLVTVISNEALANLEQKIDISVYLKPKLDEASIMSLKAEIEALPGVKAVNYVTADQALTKFKEKYQNNESIAEALILLGVNPLGASLNIKAYSEQGYQTILNSLEGELYTDLIQEARFDDYRQVISGINDLAVKVENVGIGISIIFLVIALLVVFNTIRINIYSQREEIEIKRLVGATNWYIRAPFWVESIIYALLATLITAVIFYFSLSWLDPYVASLFDGYQ
ncbi:MAG: permease-like cell division protein FtsX, partial [Patescibacteria group bacterium]